VTRVLGVHDDVPVDALGVEPHHGDRFVLCSDGLFNEVPEAQIAAVLRRLADPVDAAGELVRRALDGGGRDNVTVVVVDVVDDGGRDQAASAAVGAEGGTARRAVAAGGIATTGAYADAEEAAGVRTRRLGRRGAGGPGRGTASTRAASAAPTDGRAAVNGDELDDDAYDDEDEESLVGGRRRRVTWRVVLFTLLIVAIIGGAIATIQWYGRAAYFVGFQGDQVAIFKGRPGGLLWIDPSLVESTDLDRDRVPPSRLRDLEDGKEQASLADAQRYVRNISAEADELDPPTTTTTTTTSIPPGGTVPPTVPTGTTLTPLTSTPAPAVPG
jgi:protein phosphatase